MNFKRLRVVLCSLIFISTMLAANQSFAAIKRVMLVPPATGPWASADTDLQRAISTASAGDEIWVASGTYKPTDVNGFGYPNGGDPLNPREMHFSLKNRVTVLGGFNGTETLSNQRNPTANVTICSGDIGTAVTTDNCYHVFYHPSTMVTPLSLLNTTIIDGFTITGGNADGIGGPAGSSSGAGFFNENSTFQIKACKIQNNTSTSHGAGIYNDNSPITITTSVITNPANVTSVYTSSIQNNSTGGNGGGIYNDTSDVTLESVDIGGATGNSATGSGGGIYNSACTIVIIRPAVVGANNTYYASTIQNNTSGGSGAGICNISSTVTITSTAITGNTATGNGGGIYNSASTFTVQSSTPTIAGVNTYKPSTIQNNSAANGGGIYNANCNAALQTVTIKTSSIQGNTATTGSGGGIYNSNSNVTIASENDTINNTTHPLTIQNNTAYVNGGGIYNTNCNNFSPTPSVIIASALTTYPATKLYAPVTIQGNTATTGNGGGIYNNNSIVSLRSLDIGGAIAGNGNKANNTLANGYGGGIYNAATSTVSIIRLTYTDTTT
ncbi:MAG: hypothetical protein WCP55_20820, partial [Lentisphaerota bacterium]